MNPVTANDRTRSLALAAATAGFTMIPTLVPLITGKGNGESSVDTAISPPPYAFGIWGPIFAGCVANTVQHSQPERVGLEINRRSGWALAGAYTSNAIWAILDQTGRNSAKAVALPVAVGFAATAYARLQREAPTGADRIAPASTGMLLGWTSLAALIELSVRATAAGTAQTSGKNVAETAAAVGLSAALSMGILRSNYGFIPLGAAATWGLGTTSLVRARPTVARIGSAVGASLVAASTVIRARQRRI